MMTSTEVIRKACVFDLDAAVDLIEKGFATDDNQKLLGKRVLRAIYDLILESKDTIFFVAEFEGRVVSIIWVQIREQIFLKYFFSPVKALKLAWFLFRERKFPILIKIISQDSYSGETAAYPRIVSLIVAAQFRRHGLGSKLIEESLRKLKARGEKSCFVATGFDNKASVDFYKRNGFSVIRSDQKQVMFEIKLPETKSRRPEKT